jgi:hypothetical protein
VVAARLIADIADIAGTKIARSRSRSRSTDALVVPVAIFGSLRHTKIVAATTRV